MSTRRISVTLTEDEYQALAAEAERERRSISQQAAHRLTRREASFTINPSPGDFVSVYGEPHLTASRVIKAFAAATRSTEPPA